MDPKAFIVYSWDSFVKKNHQKFIPILAHGDWAQSAPSWLLGKFYVDLSPDRFESGYRGLLDTLHNRRRQAPPIKKNALLDKEDIESSAPKAEQEDISIIRIIEEECTIPRQDGTRGSALYTIPFQLSKTPTSYTTMHRPGIASVVGRKVHLRGTTMEEVERYHKKTLILSVETANSKEKAEIQRLRLIKERELERTKEHEAEIRNGANRIKF